MKKPILLSLLFFWHLFSSASSGLARGRYAGSSRKKLFVFGDSYADTGNWGKSDAVSWKLPYGVTFPGTPSGRFSDGRILTDYIASYLGIRSPVPYEQRKTVGGGLKKKSRFGMNFAYGGTGVFDTDISKPNMSSQITLFQHLRKQVYTPTDLKSSIALVSLGGNDYATYLKRGANISLAEFTKSVINQLVLDLKRIQNLGVPKIGVTLLEPLGCLPSITFLLSDYKNCSQSFNEATMFHNQLLQQSVEKLNHESKNPTFFILDIYGAFLSALEGHRIQPGKIGYGNLLEPCCQGISDEYTCGSKEGDVPKYTVCKNPGLAFFWDNVHPAQNGWYQVYRAIKPALKQLL